MKGEKMGPYPHIELPKCDTMQDHDVGCLIEQPIIPILDQEVFVVCRSHKRAGYLMGEFLKIVDLPNMTKVIKPKREVIIGHETIRFISRYQMDEIFKARHGAQVVWDWELEEALDRYRERLEKENEK